MSPEVHDVDVLPRPRRRRPGRVLAAVFIAVAVVLAGGATSLVLVARSELAAPAGDHSHAVVLVVTPGEAFGDVVDELDRDGLIKSKTWFSLYARVKGLSSVAPGRYRLDSGMSAGTIIGALSVAPVAQAVKITFQEGLTAKQMATIVEASGVGITAQQYLDEATRGQFDEPFLGHRPAGASLEGFLFPDTYDVGVGATAHQLVQMQLDAFNSKAAPLLTQIPATQSDYQVVILASIVEREARFDDDRPLVASVIDNRLAAGMPLQVDATVNYGTGRTSGEPTQQELQKDTPYNTYLHTGLTPTPISNPGVASITAAAKPAHTGFLYYVSDGCGHNHYAATLAEHQKNVAMYVGKPCAQ